jgi:hypothetical protein
MARSAVGEAMPGKWSLLTLPASLTAQGTPEGRRACTPLLLPKFIIDVVSAVFDCARRDYANLLLRISFGIPGQARG